MAIEGEAGRQVRYVQAGSGFLSEHSKDVFFGLGQQEGSVMSVDSLAQRIGATASRSAHQFENLGGRRSGAISRRAL